MDKRILALAAVASLLLLAVPASSAAVEVSQPDQTRQEPCGGVVAVLCEHHTTPSGSLCILYVSPTCVAWIP